MNNLERLTDLIVDTIPCNREEIRPESSFVDDLGADSLDLVELVMAIEDEFDVEINDDEFEKVKTVAEALTLIEARLPAE